MSDKTHTQWGHTQWGGSANGDFEKNKGFLEAFEKAAAFVSQVQQEWQNFQTKLPNPGGGMETVAHAYEKNREAAQEIFQATTVCWQKLSQLQRHFFEGLSAPLSGEVGGKDASPFANAPWQSVKEWPGTQKAFWEQSRVYCEEFMGVCTHTASQLLDICQRLCEEEQEKKD